MDLARLLMVTTLCDEDFFYCAVPHDVTFPYVRGVPRDWYEQGTQLDCRKYYIAEKTRWLVTPMLYTEDEEKSWAPVEMTDREILAMWTSVITVGGCVSDGVINLFGDNHSL